MSIKFIRPQSRFIMKKILKRDYDTLTISGQNNVDKIILVLDIAIVVGLIIIL